jgi:hypothetical protein
MTEERELKKEANESAGTTDNEEIIELTEEVGASAREDDEIIELKDEVVEPGPPGNQSEATAEAVAGTENVAAETRSEDPDGIPTPTDASEAILNGDIKISDEFDDEEDEESQDDFLNAMGMDLETDSAISEISEEEEFSEPEQDIADEPITGEISSDQIEAAIERVIMKILPEKIESILTEAIERTLKREIDKLKGVILEDSSGEKE